MAIINEPVVHIVGRQQVDDSAVQQFLGEHGTSWETDSQVGGELLSEMGGRVCYMAFGVSKAADQQRISGEHSYPTPWKRPGARGLDLCNQRRLSIAHP